MPKYSDSIFINCPFDDGYQEMFRARGLGEAIAPQFMMINSLPTKNPKYTKDPNTSRFYWEPFG